LNGFLESAFSRISKLIGEPTWFTLKGGAQDGVLITAQG